MSTVPCPGCGLPRATELIDASPCPVCGQATAEALDLEDAPLPEPRVGPAADLPADASQLAKWTGAKTSRFGVGLTLGFAFGALAGLGGALAWQRGFALPEVIAGKVDAPTAQAEAAVAPTPSTPFDVKSESGTQPPVAVAPSLPEPTIVGDEPAEPMPRALQPPPPPGQPVVIEVNQPDGSYALPFPTQNREHVILKGKAKEFRLAAVGGGATVDASALDARAIRVGDIDGGARVKLHSPDGSVTVTGKLDGQAALEINAPGGEVSLSAAVARREMPLIDGGAKLTVTAKRVAIRGDVRGAATHVRVTLTRAGSLHVGAVQGTAVVEYRSANSAWSYSTVTVGPVAPSATVRELGPKPEAVVDDNF